MEAWYQKYATRMGYEIDSEREQDVVPGLERNKELYGARYCPCRPSYLYKSANHVQFICPCKEFRETGFCHCGLFICLQSD